MSEHLEHRAELLKLARLLNLDVEELPDLDAVPAAELRAFREAATDRLFDATAGTLGGISKSSRLVPAAVSATIARKAFGPLLCARTAAAVDPPRAVDIAKRLPKDFLADVSVELDPRRVADILAEVPDDLSVPVAEELGRRGEFVTMGRFLAFVSDAGIEGAMNSLSDEALLQTAFVLEHKDKLGHAVSLLDPARMPGILRCAAEQDLWPEALDLISHLDDAERLPVARALASLDEEHLTSLVAALDEVDLWDTATDVLGMMEDGPARKRLVAASGGRVS